VKLALKKPIAMGESLTIAELTFREEVVAGDLRGLKVQSLADPLMDDLLKIASRLTGQPEVVMSKLGMADLAEVVTLVSGFLNAGPETGTTL
jgi:hypothetical protein